MHSDFMYQELSSEVYRIDPKHKNHRPIKSGLVREFGNQEYKILKVESTPTNGMQAMAVAS